MKKIILFSLSIIAIIIISCTKDFIVKDIKNATVNLIAPADNIKTPSNTLTFWWDVLDGAEKYNLQIVKPSFSSAQQLLVDTNITTNKFNYTFTPGTYQWRVKATNGGGSTIYTTRTLIVDTTSNLSFVSVSLSTPTTNYLTRTKSINFQWNSLHAATGYNLEIDDVGGAMIASIPGITNTSYIYTFTNTADVNYSWKVQATNSFGSSQYSSANTFTIDVTPPNVSTLSFPIYGAVANGLNDTLRWTRHSSNSIFDTKYDSIIVSLDSNFISPPSIALAKVYGTKLKISSLSPPLSYPSLPGNNYYWLRIISVDSVRNMSLPSGKAKFKLN